MAKRGRVCNVAWLNVPLAARPARGEGGHAHRGHLGTDEPRDDLVVQGRHGAARVGEAEGPLGVRVPFGDEVLLGLEVAEGPRPMQHREVHTRCVRRRHVCRRRVEGRRVERLELALDRDGAAPHLHHNALAR